MRASRSRQTRPSARGGDRPGEQTYPLKLVETTAGNVIIFAAALLCAAVTFGPALHGPFVFDDFHLPFADGRAAQMPMSFWTGGVRPLLMLTYLGNYRISGTGTFSYHLVNLLLHALTAVLVCQVLHRVASLAGGKQSLWPSLLGTAVFLLHPLQTESVNYIAGRSEILCTVFVLGAWLLLLANFERRLSGWIALAILPCAAAAMLSKESGICVVGILLATDFYWRKSTLAEQLHRRRLLYAPACAGALVAAFLILRQLQSSRTAGFSSGVTPLEYALTQCRVIATYIRLFFYPAGQNIDWKLPFYHSVSEGSAAVFLLATAILMFLIVYLFNRFKAVSFGLLVFLLALAPTSSFVPIEDALAERRMYLPIIGLVIALSALITRFPRVQLPARVLVPAWLLLLAVASHARSQLWSSDIQLWKDSLERNPTNGRAHSWLAGAYMLRKDCSRAAGEFQKATLLEGLTAENGRNLAVAYDCGGDHEKALAAYRALVKISPTADSYNRIGVLEALRDNVDGALGAFEEALHLNPNNANAYAYRGTARAALGDPKGARSDFDRAFSLDPENAAAMAGMAKLPAAR